MAKKGINIKVRMVSTGTNEKGNPTGYTYYTKKNPRTQTEKLRLKKYDPRAVHPETGKRGSHVVFEEKKMPPSKKN